MLNETNRSVLDAILDELIPPSDDGKIPGAGALGVAEFLPTAQAYAPDPAGSVQTIIDAVSGDFEALPRDEKVAVLKRVEAAHVQAFETLVRLTYMGYYSRPDMRPHFGVGSHPIHPKGYPVERETDALMDELTAPVRARGKAYRDAK
ncbi:gluconate 2-dehydrogenase subunit 3 family protein [Phaeobacter sp. C3_T13_0]|uniref:gluconate 2-dehydrogenase subunit 3 family protein n=1 Tax=Phaeobacter cretensis TaxID=3342641 RepID=UPI0039BC83F4